MKDSRILLGCSLSCLLSIIMWIIIVFALLWCFETHASCIQDAGVLIQNTNCVGHPSNPKYFTPTTFHWKGKEILVVNDGNELIYYNITNPASPSYIAKSSFNVPNQGDSDYDLMNYTICDDCAYGVATFKLGIVIWSQGTGTTPRFAARQFYPIGTDPRGAFTYMGKFDTQFLLAKYLPDDAGVDATLYAIKGINLLEAYDSVDVPGENKITNGFDLGDYILVGFTDNRVYTLRKTPTGLSAVGYSGIRASLTRIMSMDVDGSLVAAGFITGAGVWNFSDPEHPVQVRSFSGSYNGAAISGDFLWLNMTNNTIKTYYGAPSYNQELDYFWDSSNPWNQFSSCDTNTGGAFSDDASRLFVGRYAAVQKVNMSECPPPDVIFEDGFESGSIGVWR